MGDFPETVEVRVSHHALTDEFIIETHKVLLVRSSPYYRAVFQGRFADWKQETFTMEISYEDMHTFQMWLYYGELNLDRDIIDYQQLIRLYIFADYYGFPALRRAIMSLLVQHNKEHDHCRVPHLPLLEDCLSQLPHTSPLYQWLAGTWSEHIDDLEEYGPDAQHLWHEMPLDFRLLVFSSRRYVGACYCCHNPCNFHEHENEEEWKRSKSLSRCVTWTH